MGGETSKTKIDVKMLTSVSTLGSGGLGKPLHPKPVGHRVLWAPLHLRPLGHGILWVSPHQVENPQFLWLKRRRASCVWKDAVSSRSNEGNDRDFACRCQIEQSQVLQPLRSIHSAIR